MEDKVLNIVHVVTPMSWRGGEQQAAYLMHELQSAGQNQIMVCAKGSAMESYCEKHGLPFRSLKKRSSFDPVFASKLSKICREFNADLVHAHGSHAHTFTVLAARFFGNKAPIIVSRRVDFPVSRSWFSRYKYNYPNVARILCVSDAIKDMTAPALKQPEKLATIHSGIDLSRFPHQGKTTRLRDELNLSKIDWLIGNVAALAPHKDYFTFIDTVALLTERGFKASFLIIGDGPLKQEIHDYVAQKNLDGVIHFTGFRKDIPEVLPELDLFLITSKTEGLGTSILDALACKVPVVATNAGGIPEIIHHLDSGWLGKVGDPESLAEGVETVLSDPNLKQKLIEGGSRKLRAFTKEETARRTLEVYLEVVSETA